MPESWSSIGWATVRAIVSESAPSYVAETRTIGGVMSGYCESDRMRIAIRPEITMMSERTVAKIGRRMQN